MTGAKGPVLEELARAYFSKQGFFALRSVPYRFDGEDVTDLDVWLYARQAASVRVRAIVDVKNKKSSKAFERVLWVKGVQAALSCDRAVVVTPDTSAAVVKYAHSQRIAIVSKSFLERAEKMLELDRRVTLEQFVEHVHAYRAHKQDGDWLRVLGEAKSAVASMSGFPAFNRTILSFRFFAERAEVRAQHRDQAVRCALLTAALSCVALDAALERFVYDDLNVRHEGLRDGITYGDAGDGRVKQSIETALAALAEGMKNGRVIAAQAREQLEKRFSEIRADVVAEYFMREQNAQHLFAVARELDQVAHSTEPVEASRLSIAARSALGVFADFVGVKRVALPIGITEPSAMTSHAAGASANSGSSEHHGAEKLPRQEPLL